MSKCSSNSDGQNATEAFILSIRHFSPNVISSR